MARIIDSAELDSLEYDEEQGHWLYNALDAAVTSEILEEIKPQLDEYSSITYNFSRAIQAPLLEMMLRGVLVDENRRAEMEREYQSKLDRLEWILNLYGDAIWSAPINARSHHQLKALFYEWMNIPPVYKYVKGERKLTVDRDALEKIEAYFHARPVVRAILSIREYGKILQVLRKGIDSDGRIRTSYNIGGTETGRLSSSENAFGTGDNLQNWADDLRVILCADPGQKLGYIDLETAESLAVAYLANDENYIEACETGDVHTAVARLVWRELQWTGDLKHDRALAEEPYYRWFDRRFMCKKGGHGTNYYGKAYTIAKHMHAEEAAVQDFQDRYFHRFPGIRRWHQEVAQELQLKGFLITPFARRRCFFGRRWEDETLREAIAYCPQSIVADAMNFGILKLWRAGICQCLMNWHDAVVIQYPEEDENWIIPRAIELMLTPIPIHDKILTIPLDAMVGWNLKKYDKKNPLENPDGLVKFEGHDSRVRQHYPRLTATNLLQRNVS